MDIKQMIKDSKFSFAGIVLTLLLAIFVFVSFKTGQQGALVGVAGFHPPLVGLLGIVAIILKFIASDRDQPSLLKKIFLILFFPSILLTIGYFISFKFPFFGLVSIILSIIVGAFVAISYFTTRKDDLAAFNDIDQTKSEDDDQTDTHPGDFVIGEMYKRNVDEDGNVPEGEDEYVLTKQQAVLPLHDRFVHTIVLGVTGSGKTSQTLLPMFVQDFESDNFQYEDISVVQLGQIILEPKGDFAKTAWAIGKIKEPEKRNNYMKFLMRAPEKMDTKIKDLYAERQRLLDIRDGVPLTKDEQTLLNKEEKMMNGPKFEKLTADEKLDTQTSLDKLYKKMNGYPLSLTEEQNLELLETSIKKLLYIKREIPKYIDLTDFNDLKSKSSFALFKYSALLTDIISNPSISDTPWDDFVQQDPQEKRDLVRLFDPSGKDSAYFNPLYGREEVAVGTVTTTLLAFMSDSSDFFQNMGKTLAQNAIHVAKRVYGNDATLLHIKDLFENPGGRGEEMLKELQALPGNASQSNENRDLAQYFLNDYYSGMNGSRTATKTYEQSSGIRNILNNLLDNPRLSKVLNPPKGVGTSIDFDKILRTGDKVALSTATGVSDELGKMLGSFLILQLQDAIFRRPGKEETRTPVILYIDEFQDYASSSFEDVLTKGRSYVVSATMATQTLGIVESKAGSGLVSNLQSNARNVVVYPGASAFDAKYFVSLFGARKAKEVKRSVSQELEGEKSRMDMLKEQLMLNQSDGGPARESVSESLNTESRFDETQVMYGPNVHTRADNRNDSFGDIFFRIIKDKSPQTPAVAKINWIPKDLKRQSDELIRAYDSVNLITPDDQEDDTPTPITNEDPLQDTSNNFDADDFAKESVESVKQEEVEDPDKLTRDKVTSDISIPADPVDLMSPVEESPVTTPPVTEQPDLPDIPEDIPDLSTPDFGDDFTIDFK